MEQLRLRGVRGFTLVELLIVVLCFTFAFYLFIRNQPHSTKSPGLVCLNNLKQIGVAARVWADDNGGLYPAQLQSAAGGWKDYLTNANAGVFCYTNYTILRRYCGSVPKLMVCPLDERKPAKDFGNGFGNENVSYFVNVEATVTSPRAMLMGDRNLGPGPKPDSNYGYSPVSGKGNDVVISTNSAVNPLSWSVKMHSKNISIGGGNILMGDGSVQKTSNRSLARYQINATGNATFRLVFP